MRVEFYALAAGASGPSSVMDSSELAVIPRVGEYVYGLDGYSVARVTRVNHLYELMNPRVEVFVVPFETTILASLTIGPNGEAIHGDHSAKAGRWWKR